MESTRALVQLIAPVMEQSSLIQLSWVDDAMTEHSIKDRNFVYIYIYYYYYDHDITFDCV